MKISAIVLTLFATAVVSSADIVPNDPKTPLFQLFEMELLPHKGSDPRTHQMNAKKLLLTILRLRDLTVLREDAVQVTLTPKDAKAFARLTHTHDYLILIAGDQKAMVVMHMSAPIDDGVITFDPANYSTEVARYLRRRCTKSPNQSMPFDKLTTLRDYGPEQSRGAANAFPYRVHISR